MLDFLEIVLIQFFTIEIEFAQLAVFFWWDHQQVSYCDSYRRQQKWAKKKLWKSRKWVG